MNPDDRKAIEDLFGKLKAAEHSMPQREPAAEAFIHDQMKAQPGSAYYMAQTIVVQEHALVNANARIAELERQATAAREEPRRGGLFGSLFGGGSGSRQAQPLQNARGPWGQGGAQQQMPAARGGGFLAGAAQTAVGVAGGVLLGNAVAGMFGGGEAEAATPAEPAAPTEDPGFEDTGADEGGFFDGFGEEW